MFCLIILAVYLQISIKIFTDIIRKSLNNYSEKGFNVIEADSEICYIRRQLAEIQAWHEQRVTIFSNIQFHEKTFFYFYFCQIFNFTKKPNFCLHFFPFQIFNFTEKNSFLFIFFIYIFFQDQMLKIRFESRCVELEALLESMHSNLLQMVRIITQLLFTFSQYYKLFSCLFTFSNHLFVYIFRCQRNNGSF